MAPKNDRPRSMAADIMSAVREGTKKWARTRKAEERAPASRSYRYARMTRERGVSFKDAAAEILPEAYAKVSGDGQYPANARQLMYASRPHIQEVTGQPLKSNYFTQTLLPDYINETGVDWDVIFDARGHFHEPHTGEVFGVGTLEVRQYLHGLSEPEVVNAEIRKAKVTTSGPTGNYGAVLFIEKEGFDPLLKSANFAERFDIAIMSTKGMSVTAARTLVDEMCNDHDIPLLLLHDFDKAGFSIAGTLQRDTRRYEFQNQIKVIDLGLGLDDVTRMRLATEYQYHGKGTQDVLMDNMRENGASEAEIEFMFRDFNQTDPAKHRSTRRVELNAMTSPQFVSFLERKLRANGVAKIVPDKELLAETYVAMRHSRRFQEAVDELVEEGELEPEGENGRRIKVPKDLAARVHKYLKKHPEKRWDDGVNAVIMGRA